MNIFCDANIFFSNVYSFYVSSHLGGPSCLPAELWGLLCSDLPEFCSWRTETSPFNWWNPSNRKWLHCRCCLQSLLWEGRAAEWEVLPEVSSRHSYCPRSGKIFRRVWRRRGEETFKPFPFFLLEILISVIELQFSISLILSLSLLFLCVNLHKKRYLLRLVAS